MSLHSFGALFLFSDTQPHNPTAALHERAAPGELRLSRKFRKSRSTPGTCEFGQCRSLHSFGALFLFSGTQLHNPTAALHERAAPGELRLSRKFRKSRSTPGACEFGQCRSIHLAPCFCSAALNCTIQLLHYTKERRQGSSGSRGNSARAAAPLAPVSLASVAPFIWRPVFALRHSTAQSNCCTT